jgi:gamma-glutamylaminecyclotransferase
VRVPLVFAYGTLMRGECRHEALADQAFVARATTQPHYRLYNCGSYPALVEVECDTGRRIQGEVWCVSAACLARLDEIEGVDEGLYERGPVALENSPVSNQVDAAVEAYFYRQDVSTLEDLGTGWPRSGSA